MKHEISSNKEALDLCRSSDYLDRERGAFMLRSYPCFLPFYFASPAGAGFTVGYVIPSCCR
jgi:hypothetical protein